MYMLMTIHMHMYLHETTNAGKKEKGENRKGEMIKNKKGNINLRKCFDFRFHFQSLA